jgi:signal transduction histidine kinase
VAERQPGTAEAGDPAAVRARAAFMRDLAHELATPLTPLVGYLKILQGGKLGALTDQQRRVVETMGVSVGRLTRIIENLGDFATLGTERAPLTLEPLDPDALAAQLVEELGPFIRDARLKVTLVRAPGAPIRADPRKLRQALGNVLSNAVKFSPHGAEVLVEVARDGEKLRLAVWDQGPGVPETEAEAIFEPFHRSGSRAVEEVRRIPGSGLGLPVARRIAEAHGGHVWLESPPRARPPGASHPYSGCRFVLEIPI